MTTLDDAAERQRFKRIVVECYPRSKGISADEQEALIDIMLVVWRQATRGRLIFDEGINLYDAGIQEREDDDDETRVVSRRLPPTGAPPSLEEKLRVLRELKDRALRESQSGMADSRGMDRLTAAALQAIIDDISPER